MEKLLYNIHMDNFFKRLLHKVFKKKSPPLPLEARQWNAMWDQYADGVLPPPYQALCEYESGVQGEGHALFFDNNEEELSSLLPTLQAILPASLWENLQTAYQKYLRADESMGWFEEHDVFYYEREGLVHAILSDYAKTISIDEEKTR